MCVRFVGEGVTGPGWDLKGDWPQDARWALVIGLIIRQVSGMETTVTELLRDFPKIRRAVLSGETVLIRSREGDMRLTRDSSEPKSLLGALRGLARTGQDIVVPTTAPEEWKPSL